MHSPHYEDFPKSGKIIGPEKHTKYLGHFAKAAHMRAGHNTIKVAAVPGHFVPRHRQIEPPALSPLRMPATSAGHSGRR